MNGSRSTIPPRGDLLAVGILVLLGVAFSFEMVLMDAVPVARDIQVFFIPHKHILWESLQRLEIPLWTPLVRWGYPVLANFQSGVLYPLHWVYAALPFLTGFNYLVVLHLLMAGGFMYLLCRELEFGRPAAWMAAVTFMLGGYVVSLTNLVNHLQAAAWSPALVWALVRHVRVWRGRTLALMIAVYLLAFLAGAPQTFLLGAATAFGFALVWAGGHFRRRRLGWIRVVAATTVAAVAVIGLAMIQILPTMEMLDLSIRRAGLPYGEAIRFSLDPVRLVHLVLPNDFADPDYQFGGKLQLTDHWPWLFSTYLGVTAMLLAWFARKDRAARDQIIYWLVIGVVGVVLALGRHSTVYGWLFQHMPGFAAFRFPEKFFFFTGFSVAMLTAYGAEEFLETPDLDRVDLGFFATCLALGLGAKLAWVFAPDRIHGLLRTWSPGASALEDFGFAYVEFGSNLETGLVLVVAVIVLLGLRSRGWLSHAVFVPLLGLTLTLDLWVPHRNLNPVVDPSFYTDRPEMTRALPLEEVQRRFRYRTLPFDENVGKFYTYPDLPIEATKWYWQQTMHPNTGVLRDVLAHDSEDAIHLDLVRRHDELLTLLPPARRNRLLRLGSVKYVFSTEPAVHISVTRRTKLDSVPGYLYQLDGPLPRTFLARGRIFDRELNALNAILHPRTDYRRRVALLPPGSEVGGLPPKDSLDRTSSAGDGVDPLLAGSPDDSLPAGVARIVEDTGERVTIRLQDVQTPSYLVLNDTYYPGWHAYVDGEERSIYRANYFFRAVPVQPGDRTVVFRYRSEPFRRGMWISFGSLVLCLVGFSVTGIRGRW